jgi:hypothetical protein
MIDRSRDRTEVTMSEQAHVLIVEDNSLDRALLDAHLSRDGFDTEFAGDGVEAWAMLDAHPGRYLLLEEAHFTYRTIEEARDLASVLARACPDAESTVIGLTELLVNAVEHGNLGITYDEKSALLAEGGWAAEVARRLTLPENQGKRVDVRFQRADSELRFTICDRGNGFEWERYLDIDPRRAFDRHGRGILMARHVRDRKSVV